MQYTDEGEGLPVLFLPAFPYHRGMWEGQRAALRGKARFLSLDPRGLGPGAPAAATYMLEHLVDDVLALLDARGIDRVALCGCSMGGYVALRLAERAPERVRGLLLADTQAAPDSDEVKLGRAAGLRLLAREGTTAFAEAQLARQLSPHTAPAVRTQLRGLIEQSSSAGIAAAMVAIATRTDTRPALANIRVPARVIGGEDDTITTPAIVGSLTAAIAGAELHLLPRAGHLPNVEAEAAFNALLLDFVQGLPS